MRPRRVGGWYLISCWRTSQFLGALYDAEDFARRASSGCRVALRIRADDWEHPDLCYGDYDPDYNPCDGCEWAAPCEDDSWPWPEEDEAA